MSKLKSQIELWANVTIETKDAKSGKVLKRVKTRNKVVLTGRNLVRDLIGGIGSAAPTDIALGTSSQAVNDNDSALVAEEYRDIITRRVSGASFIQLQLYVSDSQGNGYTYAEAGLISAVGSTSTLFARTTFTPIEKTSGVTITVTWRILIGSGV